MKVLDKRTTVDAVKLLIFIVVTTLATGLLVVTIGNLSFGDDQGVQGGLQRRDRRRQRRRRPRRRRQGRQRRGRRRSSTAPRALVTFKVDADQAVTDSTFATIRYRNLVGQRYIALTQGVGGPALLAGGRHHPADADGAGARPDRAVQRLQAAVRGAVARPTSTSSPTRSSPSSRARAAPWRACWRTPPRSPRTLASRDQIIGELITNLNDVMVTLGNRDKRAVRPAGQAAGASSPGSRRTARRSSARSTRSRRWRCRPPTWSPGSAAGLTKDVNQLRKVAGTLDGNKAEIDRALQVLPIKLEQDRPHRDVRLLVQLLPLQLQGPREAARRSAASRSSRTSSTTPEQRGATSDEHPLP